jgi:hypothetical protein
MTFRNQDRENETVSFVADVRGKTRFCLLVWSPVKRKVVKLPLRFRNGKTLTHNNTPTANHWASLSAPRWLVNREALWSPPKYSATRYEWPKTTEPAATDAVWHCETDHTDALEFSIAHTDVDLRNHYVRRPGQFYTGGRNALLNAGT